MGKPPLRPRGEAGCGRPASSHYQRLPSEGKLSPGEKAPYPVIAACCFAALSLLPGNDQGKGGHLPSLSQGTASFPSLPAARKGSAPRFPQEQVSLGRDTPPVASGEGDAASSRSSQFNTEEVPRKQQVCALASQI